MVGNRGRSWTWVWVAFISIPCFASAAGDFDGDGDVDLADFLEFERCHSGHGVLVPSDCTVFDSDGDGDVDLADVVAFQAAFTGVAPFVSAETGGTLTTPEGIVLDIPPGALPRDTRVTITLVSPEDLPSGGIVGVRFSPDGLTLNVPATLRLPLPKPRTPETAPVIWEFLGTDPRGAYFTSEIVELEDDGWTAILSVRHFSGRGCADNCHAGTREFLEAQFLARGCSRERVKMRVAAKYTGFTLPDECNFIGPDAINALLDTFFDEVATFPAPNDLILPVDQEFIERMKQAIDDDRNVVLAFNKRGFLPRNPNNRHWISGNPAHTAAVVRSGGAYQIRNVVNSRSGNKLDVFLNGNNVLFWPLDGPGGLDFFRAMRSGEAVERAGCTVFAFGCSGIFPSDPSRRPRNWNAVKIFFERPESDPCHRAAGCWRLSFSDGSEPGDDVLICEIDVVNDQPRLARIWSVESGEGGESIFEWFRFTQPNGAANDPAWLNVGESSGLVGVRHTQSVHVNDEQTEMSIDIQLDLLSEMGVADRIVFNMPNLVFATDQPAEMFQSRDPDSARITVESPVCGPQFGFGTTVTVVGQRVPCPNPATDDTVFDQAEQAQAERLFVEVVSQVDPDTGECFECGIDVCGQGVAGTMPLLMLGLSLMRFQSARSRRRKGVTQPTYGLRTHDCRSDR